MTAADYQRQYGGVAKPPKKPSGAPPVNADSASGVSVPPDPYPPVLVPHLHPRWPAHHSSFSSADKTDRVLFPKIPKEYTQAFILHCQTFQP